MPCIAPDAAPRFALHQAEFTGLASPSRGATENSVWIVALEPGNTPVPHRLSREETLVAISGRAHARIDGETHELVAGGAVVVPAGAEFALHNPGPEPFRAVAVLPVGGQATIAGQPPFVPPWAT